MALFRRNEILQESVLERGDEDLYLSILSHLPSSILILDAKLRVTFANRNFILKSRKDEREILGKPVTEVFPPVILFYTDLETKIRTVHQTGKPFEGGEMEYRAPGLANRVYFYSLTPLKDEEGWVKSVMLFMDDVTEKKSLGERVIKAERHLASVVESANDLIVSMDARGLVMTWNSAAERTLGFPAFEVVRRSFGDLFMEGDRTQLQLLFAQLTKGAEAQETEAKMRTKDGREVLIAWRYSAMRNDREEMVAVVGVGRDLTEKRRLELKLLQSAKMAALGEMAGGIAHEIRNPLAVTSSAAQILLKKGGDPDLRKECAYKIRAASARAAEIIENLLRFARPSEGLVDLVNLNTTIEDTLSMIEHQISLQGIEIRKHFAPGLPSLIGNRNQLQQVFMNIILNAYHAMPQGGTLTISTRVKAEEGRGRGFAEVSFQDTGCGIPEENLSRIFDPFFTTMPVGQGTGLGLSIAYSIVRHHNGSIRVESQTGRGSTFTVTLPLGAPVEEIERGEESQHPHR